MLPKERRIKKSSEFASILALNDKKKIGPILIFRQQSGEPARFGLIVTKKISKKAVRRNYLRRVLAENIRLMLKEKEIKDNWIMMLLFDPEYPFPDLLKSLQAWAEKL